jgi:hypothetical protein
VLNSSISSQQQRSLILEQVNALGADVESFQLRPSPPLPLLNQRLERLRKLNSQLQAELETLSIPELQQRSDRLLRELLDLASQSRGRAGLRRTISSLEIAGFCGFGRHPRFCRIRRHS